MATLDAADLSPDAMTAVAAWVDEARAAGMPDWDAMVVATAAADGTPSARVVLLRGVDDAGLRFYSNYESRKGRELDANPRAAIVLHWAPQGRQVRVVGSVERMSPEDSVDYWSNRPRASRLSAWASRQSEPVADRAVLERTVGEVADRFASDGDDVPLPPFWGGYIVRPDEVELWQHRDDRLHDRIAYRRDGARWSRTRLQP
jgi:pyridoxamine 5'-phosphate oxidase